MVIQDFQTLRRTHQPDILSKQSKDKLKDTEAYIKWDIDEEFIGF
jgi:hypothetical protein